MSPAENGRQDPLQRLEGDPLTLSPDAAQKNTVPESLRGKTMRELKLKAAVSENNLMCVLHEHYYQDYKEVIDMLGHILSKIHDTDLRDQGMRELVAMSEADGKTERRIANLLLELVS